MGEDNNANDKSCLPTMTRLLRALLVVSATVRRFDCTFDDDDYCGYSDQSEGPVKWIRSKAHQHASPGKSTCVPTCVVPQHR